MLQHEKVNKCFVQDCKKYIKINMIKNNIYVYLNNIIYKFNIMHIYIEREI